MHRNISRYLNAVGVKHKSEVIFGPYQLDIVVDFLQNDIKNRFNLNFNDEINEENHSNYNVIYKRKGLENEVVVKKEYKEKYNVIEKLLTKNIVVEVDGISHFYKESYSRTLNSIIKNYILKKFGWNIIHIPYQEWNQCYNFKTKLLYAIHIFKKILHINRDTVSPKDFIYFMNNENRFNQRGTNNNDAAENMSHTKEASNNFMDQDMAIKNTDKNKKTEQEDEKSIPDFYTIDEETIFLNQLKSRNKFQKNIMKKETKKKSTIEREKYVYEIDYLWAYMEWHYSFEDEIKVQKNLIKDINKLKKVPKLFVSAHIIDGIINEMPKNENLCILKYTTYPNFYKKYNNELDILSKKSNNSIYNVCNYIYEVCDIADKSLTFANSPIINTTVKNVLSITKSGKKREDFNEENEKEEIEEDEIWQIYLSKTLKSINDQWLLICINDELKKIINNSGDIYFKMFNKYIKEYNEFITNHNYNITSNDKGTSGNGNNSTHMSNSNMFKNEDKNNFFELNSHNNNLNLEKLKKYKINLIFSENK
ncbi:conserved Plasmodium protein, unknown function, partial [Plasmodium ovale curtisi]